MDLFDFFKRKKEKENSSNTPESKESKIINEKIFCCMPYTDGREYIGEAGYEDGSDIP